MVLPLVGSLPAYVIVNHAAYSPDNYNVGLGTGSNICAAVFAFVATLLPARKSRLEIAKIMF